MSINLRRALLVILALVGAYTGGWAYFASRHWFRHFPGFGLSWLPQLGPYNEHLAKDSGAMFLALAVLSLFALRHVASDVVSRGTGSAWLTFNVLHPLYHFRHLDMYPRFDQVLNVVFLALAALAAAALLVPVGRRPDGSHTEK